jgi:hypothetical protein
LKSSHRYVRRDGGTGVGPRRRGVDRSRDGDRHVAAVSGRIGLTNRPPTNAVGTPLNRWAQERCLAASHCSKFIGADVQDSRQKPRVKALRCRRHCHDSNSREASGSIRRNED